MLLVLSIMPNTNTSVDFHKTFHKGAQQMDHDYKHKHFSVPLASEMVYMAQRLRHSSFVRYSAIFFSYFVLC